MLALCFGGGTSLAMIGALVSPTTPPPADTATRSTAAATATRSPTPPPSPTPSVEKRTETTTQTIPYGKRVVYDAALAAGTRQVRVKGVPGIKTLTYEITLTDGVQTGKRLVSETVTRKPVTEVTAIGTRKKSNCDPNYSGACVPIASDVDCAGGSGDGPAYVKGPVTVVGTDIYDLDRDGDGVGCES